jgi:hypothetical protein
LRSAIGTITSTRTITIERVSQDGAWQSRELRIIDEQIEILLLTTDTGNRQRTDNVKLEGGRNVSACRRVGVFAGGKASGFDFGSALGSGAVSNRDDHEHEDDNDND